MCLIEIANLFIQRSLLNIIFLQIYISYCLSQTYLKCVVAYTCYIRYLPNFLLYKQILRIGHLIHIVLHSVQFTFQIPCCSLNSKTATPESYLFILTQTNRPIRHAANSFNSFIFALHVTHIPVQICKSISPYLCLSLTLFVYSTIFMSVS